MTSGLGLWCLMPLSTIFHLYYIVAVSFIGGGNRSTQRKPLMTSEIENKTMTTLWDLLELLYMLYSLITNSHARHNIITNCFLKTISRSLSFPRIQVHVCFSSEVILSPFMLHWYSWVWLVLRLTCLIGVGIVSKWN